MWCESKLTFLSAWPWHVEKKKNSYTPDGYNCKKLILQNSCAHTLTCTDS